MNALHSVKPTLLLSGNGKTGRRVVERLRSRGRPPKDFGGDARDVAATGTWAA